MEAAYLNYRINPSFMNFWTGRSNDAYTKLLIHGDGADESQTFTDVSASGHTITAGGNAQVDTAQKKFGTGSALFDGTGDYLSVPDSADWYMASAAFTIDWWMRVPALAQETDPTIFSQRVDAINSARFFTQWAIGTTYFWFDVWVSGMKTITVRSIVTDDFKANTWHHVALIRGWGGNVNQWVITLDGTAYEITTDSSEWPNLSAVFEIGRFSTYYYKGWLDEFRVSKGIARWTANFTPPKMKYM